ncbi:hypothetical protein BWD14_10365 [Leptospira santarosai]|uniref:Uncharacterized protein n=1 Tax=Leptospira santarosai TaxID=28183 RepID=A0AB73LMC1_9LEPT|nr:hypothetical protein BWD14_10365 [Leptospira santarosai]
MFGLLKDFIIFKLWIGKGTYWESVPKPNGNGLSSLDAGVPANYVSLNFMEMPFRKCWVWRRRLVFSERVF